MPDLTAYFGMVAYGVAGLACLFAARRGRAVGFWVAFALVHLFLAVEVELGLRHSLKAGVRDAAFVQKLDKGAVQAAGLVVGGILVLLLATMIARSGSRRPAVFGLTLSVALFAVEVVSHHGLTAPLYRRLGPAALIAWLWIAACVPVVVASVRSPRESGSLNRDPGNRR